MKIAHGFSANSVPPVRLCSSGGIRWAGQTAHSATLESIFCATGVVSRDKDLLPDVARDMDPEVLTEGRLQKPRPVWSLERSLRRFGRFQNPQQTRGATFPAENLIMGCHVE